MNKNSCRESCSSARNSWWLRRQAITTLPPVGDSIRIWLNLSGTGLWWSCEVLSFSLIDRFPNFEGVPDLGQDVELEKEEGVFHPEVIISEIGEGLDRVVDFEGE